MSQQLFEDYAPVQSVMLVSQKMFFYAGRLMANSLIQGGPNPCILSDWCYKFISSRENCLPTDFDLPIQFLEKPNIKKVSDMSL